MTILDKLAASSKRLVDEKKKKLPLAELKKNISQSPSPSFFKALDKDGMSFICEIKRASPSKGIIDKNFDPIATLKDYNSAGADAISCLTEPTKFLGSLEILEEVVKNTSLPVLRKDFMVDPYQIYEAKNSGASAVLLIAALLDEVALKEMYNLTEDLGLDALVEVHDNDELKRSLNAGAKIIGINNRDLRDFSVDLNKTYELIEEIPKEITVVSESGIKNAQDIRGLKEAGVSAVLIGEALMKNADKKQALKGLKNEA